jgi:hypothetical protein
LNISVQDSDFSGVDSRDSSANWEGFNGTRDVPVILLDIPVCQTIQCYFVDWQAVGTKHHGLSAEKSSPAF